MHREAAGRAGSLPHVRGLDARVRIALAVVLVVGMAGVAPAPIDAACGGGGYDETWLARRAGRHADTIILARLIEVDADNAYHFELLKVYRGNPLPSPIENDFSTSVSGIIDVGGCTGASVSPGGLFIYATGDQAARFGRMQLIFPRVPGRDWIIDHWAVYATLDRLLGLLGVPPETATAEPDAAGDGARSEFVWPVAALLSLTGFAYWVLGKRRRDA